MIMHLTALQMLQGALEIVSKDHTISMLQSIQDQPGDPSGRKYALDAVRRASVNPETGLGTAFQESILQRAIRQVERDIRLTTGQSPVRAGQRRKSMSDEAVVTATTQDAGDTIVSKSKRYTVGDVFSTVGTMGLKPTDSDKNAVCGFQFSRKTAKQGIMDLPGNTEVKYIGAKNVYENVASSKRMIFRIAAGTKVVQDGHEITLDHDIDVAGVPNHIDPEDSYNVNARANETKRAERAALKAQAQAAKSSAA